jgi:alcohol dehydrogenase class IV
MIEPFQLARIPKINFKCGVISDLPKIARAYGKKIILVTGKSSFINSDYGRKLIDEFKKSGIYYSHITISGEPSPEVVDKAVNDLRNEEFNLVVGIGGGSVLDAGKAISAMMYKKESLLEFLEEVGDKEHPGSKIPYIAVPTTSGTGSEATKNAVISRTGVNGFKRSLRHDNLVPDIALIDPELTLNCPSEITAASGMDCFTQLTEAYLSIKSNKITDAIALEGIKAIKTSLVRSFKDGSNIEARTGMSLAALTSGICLANAGLGAVHGFATSIGGRYNIPHGIVCGTLMASANDLNVRILRKTNPASIAFQKYILLGKLFSDETGKSDDYYIDGFIQFLQNLTHELQLKGLKTYGLEENEIRNICAVTEMKNNPVKLSVDDLVEIVQRSMVIK